MRSIRVLDSLFAAHFNLEAGWITADTVSGFWLSALTFIEDGNKDFVPNPFNTDTSQPSAGGLSTSVSSSSLAATAARAGPSSETSHPPLINFFKRSLAAEILRDIQQYQSQPYNLAKSRTVYDWLMKSLEHCDRTYNLDKMYDLSLQLEPREREEERITRMLHDSVGSVRKVSP